MMKEHIKWNKEILKSVEEKRKEVIEVIQNLIMEIQEQCETHVFPGINPETIEKMRCDDEEYPGYTTPIDELLERFKSEGMKIVLGKNPESGNVYVLPSKSDDIERDSITPQQLLIEDAFDNEKIIELISQIQSLKKE